MAPESLRPSPARARARGAEGLHRSSRKPAHDGAAAAGLLGILAAFKESGSTEQHRSKQYSS